MNELMYAMFLDFIRHSPPLGLQGYSRGCPTLVRVMAIENSIPTDININTYQVMYLNILRNGNGKVRSNTNEKKCNP